MDAARSPLLRAVACQLAHAQVGKGIKIAHVYSKTGALLALWLRYAGPDTKLSFEVMLDILLIVVIGSMGTLYAEEPGSALFVLVQNYLHDVLKIGPGAPVGVAVLFMLPAHHFPSGIVGRLRAARQVG